MRKRGLLLLAGLAVALGVGLAGWWYLGQRPPTVPDLSREGMDPEVASALDRAEADVRAAPRDGKAWGKLGTLLYAHGAQAEARVCFTHAERFDPTQGRWPYLLALLSINQDREAGIRCLERAAERKSSRDLALVRLGEIHLEEGRLDEAERSLRLALKHQPQDARALFGVGKVQCQRGELRQSLESLQSAARLAPGARAVRVLLAEVHHRLGEAKEAAAQLEQLASLPGGPDWPDPLLEEVSDARLGLDVRILRVNALFEARRNADAVALLQETLERYPNSHLPYLAMGHHLARVGQARHALDALRQAAKLRPDISAIQHDLGVLLQNQREYAEAAEAFRAAAKLKAGNAGIYLRLAQCLAEVGDVKGAAEAARTVLEIDPANEEAKKLLETLARRSSLSPSTSASSAPAGRC